jgi:hypothetical protein
MMVGYCSWVSGIRVSGIRGQESGIRARHLSASLPWQAKSQNPAPFIKGGGYEVAGGLRFSGEHSSPLRKKGSGFACPFLANYFRQKVGFYFLATLYYRIAGRSPQ